jgi:hypothetical protein
LIRRHLIPEGLRVLPDGSWRVGDLPISHPRRLRFLKERLTFEEGGAFVIDGSQRQPLILEGPPFQVDSVAFDAGSGCVRVGLDDGTTESLREPLIRMNKDTGQLECAVKEGRTRAVFSNVAHQVVLDELEQEGGEFFIPLGEKRCRVLP